jgi:hypothetical protein
MENNLNIENSTGSSAGDCFAIGGICITAALICFCISLLAAGVKRAEAIFGLSAVGKPAAPTTPSISKEESSGDSEPFASEAGQAESNDNLPPLSPSLPELEGVPDRADRIVNRAGSLLVFEPETAKVIRRSHTPYAP